MVQQMGAWIVIRYGSSKTLRFESKQKCGFVKGCFWRMCPRSLFGTEEHLHRADCTYPRSGFRHRGTSVCALVLVFGTGEHPPKPPFWKPPFCQARKKSTKINFLGPETARWGGATVGGLHAKGWWPKSSCPRKFVLLAFRREEFGMSRRFCRDVPDPWGCLESSCKKSSCAFFVPSNFRESFSES